MVTEKRGGGRARYASRVDPLSAARALVPSWLPFVSLLALPFAGLAGGLAALVLTPIAYRKVLAARNAPWTERARLAWPARKWASLALVAIPAVIGALVSHLGGPLALLGRPAAGLLGGAAALAGYTLGMWPAARRLHGEAAGGPGRFFASSVAVLCVRAPHIVVAAAVAGFMPPRFTGYGAEAAALLALGTVLLFAAALGGGLAAGRFLGLIRPADERLRRAAASAASRAAVPPPSGLVMECTLPVAFAIPVRRILVVSDSALALLDDAELEAVAAHETGHLTEPRSVTSSASQASSSSRSSWPAPSLAGEGGRTAFLALLFSLLALVAAGVFSRRTSVEMERRADAHAVAHAEEGVYARALEKMHEAGLVPAVLGKRLATHPDLWDRMTAAGAPPSWPKPAPPARGGAGRFALLLVCALAFAGAEAGFARALPAIVRSSPIGAVALTGGDAWPLSELARARAAGGKPEDAVALYRAAFALDGRSGHLANAAFVESRIGRCDAARDLAADAGRAALVAGTAALDRHLAARAADVAAHCRAASARDDDPDD
jgi:Zn-dependent protease with chaperone function